MLEWAPEGKLVDREATKDEMQMSVEELYTVYNGYAKHSQHRHALHEA